MAIRRTTKVDSSFSMSSMTDIVFLLLIFFLVTSTLINPNALKLLLPKSTGQVSAKATVSVSIKHWQDNDNFSFHLNGNETPVSSMKDCSVVTATYELEEGMRGTIGIIGPKRMDYDKVIGTLKALQSQLDDLYKSR